MAKGKLILICQSGGEFVTNEDGTMTYNGGEANAANVNSETPFSELKLNLAETCNFNQETVTVKYFLPGNKRNLITVKNDKDVKRMIDFHGDALTAEVFVTGTPGFDRSALDTQTNSQSNVKNNETINNDNTSPKKDDVVKRGKVGNKKDKKMKKEDKGQKSPLASPSKRTTRRTVAAKTEASSNENEEKTETKVSKDEGSTGDTSTSADSEQVNINQDSDCSSDFVPSRYPKRKKPNVNTTPADSVKKRRRTPSWKFGANGRPTIVSNPDDSAGSKGKIGKSQRKSGRLAAKEGAGTKSGRKRGRPRAVPPPDSSDQELDDDVAPETLLDIVKVEKEKLHGHEESYNKLPWFCEKILETNPGSISKLVINENKRFKSLFVSFFAPLSGFQNSCRPLLFLESTSLRSKFGEFIFTANAIDGNDGFFPVAFAIVDTEDTDTWRWFLEILKSTILTPQPITFVFDRDKNLKITILEVFENAYIGYSIYHLLESFKRTVKGPFHGDGKSFLPVHFLTAAHAVRLVGFKKSTEQIKQISSQAYDWVMQIEPQHWTTSSFEGERYNHIVDDISINVSISKLMEDYRELPLLQKIDALIRFMIDEMNDANLDASMWGTHLTPSKEKQLQEENLRSCGLKVLISSDTLFEVREDSTHVVNLSNWSCTCLGWKETGLPCRHALAVFALIGKNPYEFCSNYFTVDAYRITYAESIAPVPIEKEEKVEKIEMITVGGGNVDVEKIEVVEEKIGEIEKEEWERVEDGLKSEKVEVEGEKMEMEKGGGENEHGVKVGGENENEEDVKVGGENENEENVKVGGENEIEEDVKIGGGDEEDVKVGGEIENEVIVEVEGGNVEGEKEEGEKCKITKEEDEVVVLPPIPVKPADEVKEKMEWEETEVETKRTVTCTKCKQPGHNKKSCNLYQVQQALINQV
ncbi:uncharacterized protein LOC111881803 [Lactuca sativa]|uniref:SWIM-type domain-containing protein n=1 Tax=Lactuca sativa TaxID=4236 RepID=A0A9R1VA96_LACSA|nr:uncharacterized protein LOC111881803 [Lactuca sativa]KAJ0202535.1 hypothetical protein LSAT_V11C500262590 [Lactuca sativa]